MGMYQVNGSFESRVGGEISNKGMPIAWMSKVVSGTKSEASIKLSSGEIESAGAADVLKLARHVKFIAEEFGIDCSERINLQTDASVAISFSDGGGGKMKHIDARLAWVQELRDKDIVRLIKVPGADNPADFYTKILPSAEFRKQLQPKKKTKVDIHSRTIGEGVEDIKSSSGTCADDMTEGTDVQVPN